MINKTHLVLLFSLILSGCTTNQIHFSSYTERAILKDIDTNYPNIDIIDIRGGDKCSNCKEYSKIVWHAANYEGGIFYEGFLPIPIDDWPKLVREAIGSTLSSKEKVEIELNRIFLKTWQDPKYHACKVELTVIKNGEKMRGESMIKIGELGQNLKGADRVSLNPNSMTSIRYSIKAAYLNAIEKN